MIETIIATATMIAGMQSLPVNREGLKGNDIRVVAPYEEIRGSNRRLRRFEQRLLKKRKRK